MIKNLLRINSKRWMSSGLLVAACFLAASTLAACGWNAAPDLPGAPTEQAAADLPPAESAEGGAPASATPATTAGATTAGATTAGATPAPGDQPVPALALAAPSELLDSYRITANYIITSLLPGGERRIDITELQGAWRRTDGPFGYDTAFTLTNISGSRRQVVGVVAVGDAVAIESDGAWSTVAREASLPYGDPDRLLSLPFITHVNRGEDLGQEPLAGVAITHYRLTDPQTFAAAVEDIAPLASENVRSVLLEGWVADAGYVVKYLLQAELSGARVLDDAGNWIEADQEVSATYSLSELDAVRPIEWPPDAQPPNTVSVPGFVPNTFPLPEGAQVKPRLGMVEIRTAAPVSDVAAFYRARLRELGWTFDGERGFYTAEKEDQRLQLTVLSDEVTGDTVVRVFATAD